MPSKSKIIIPDSLCFNKILKSQTEVGVSGPPGTCLRIPCWSGPEIWDAQPIIWPWVSREIPWNPTLVWGTYFPGEKLESITLSLPFSLILALSPWKVWKALPFSIQSETIQFSNLKSNLDLQNCKKVLPSAAWAIEKTMQQVNNVFLIWPCENPMEHEVASMTFEYSLSLDMLSVWW